MKKILLLSAVAALGLAAGPADAGVTWGTGCGGPVTAASDQCTLVAPAGAVVVGHIEGTGVPLDRVFQVTLRLVGPDGSKTLCSGSLSSAGACSGSGILFDNWGGQPIRCEASFDRAVPGTVVGNYACQVV